MNTRVEPSMRKSSGVSVSEGVVEPPTMSFPGITLASNSTIGPICSEGCSTTWKYSRSIVYVPSAMFAGTSSVRLIIASPSVNVRGSCVAGSIHLQAHCSPNGSQAGISSNA